MGNQTNDENEVLAFVRSDTSINVNEIPKDGNNELDPDCIGYTCHDHG